MKNITVKLAVPHEIYEATEQFMDEKGLEIEDELSEEVKKFYKKYVPADVRKYIERNSDKRASPSISTAKESRIGSDNHPEFGSSGTQFEGDLPYSRESGEK